MGETAATKKAGLVKMYIVITVDIRGYPFLSILNRLKTGISNSSLGLALALASILALNN
jgi:hypothetical protein